MEEEAKSMFQHTVAATLSSHLRHLIGTDISLWVLARKEILILYGFKLSQCSFAVFFLNTIRVFKVLLRSRGCTHVMHTCCCRNSVEQRDNFA